MKIFISPHNDDAVLFGCFTLLREKPLVVTVFDSYLQGIRGFPVTADQRHQEDINAICCMLDLKLRFCYVPDSTKYEELFVAVRQALKEIADNYDITHVYLPAVYPYDGNEQHNAVGHIGKDVFKGIRKTFYHTYTTKGKVTEGVEVRCEDGQWLLAKYRALECYKSQILIEALGCREHFMRDLREFYA